MTCSIGLRLIPLDTLFFGDGTPFSADLGQEDVGGVFPPHPPTVLGALRAALARVAGWDGLGRWPAHLEMLLGDGGSMTMHGPILLRDNQPLYPAPRHLLGCGVDPWRPSAVLRPGPPRRCDFHDAARLPCLAAPNDSLRPGNDWWLTRAGLARVLAGSLPLDDELVASSALWAEERRIGLERDPRTRTAAEGKLYSARHVRLHHGVALGIALTGLPDAWRIPPNLLVPLGGERRLAELASCTVEPHLTVEKSAREALARHGRLMLVALTPLDLDARPGAEIAGLAEYGGATLVSACIDHHLPVGGWNSLERRPLPLHPVLPAGSVLFCDALAPGRLCKRLDTGEPLTVGARRNHGFGLVAVGTWFEQGDVNP